MSAEPTIALVIRDTPKRLEAIKAHAKRCGMSAGDLYRYSADLALRLAEADFIRVAAARMARESEAQPPT
jgi:hypothetical protein